MVAERSELSRAAVNDRIEKVVEIAAPVAKVWKAVTDHEQFGSWFKVALDGPFVLGGVSRGHMTYPGYEHLPWLAVVERMEPERLFAFRWHVYDEESAGAIADEPTTLVEFRLEPDAAGTRVTIRELGFAALPEKRGAEAIRRNTEGWDIQARNLAEYATA